jgi:enamine deaminase RidA (YjgF/YER057c/UK114 family)
MPAFRSSPANIEIVKSDHYSEAVVAGGAWVFAAGQIARDYKTGVPEQARRHVLNRATLIGVAGALAAALVVIVLGQLPRASHADPGSPSLAVDDLQRQVDVLKLPVDFIPEP